MSSEIQNPNKSVKISNNTGDITGFRVKDFQYSTLGRLILFRLYHNRDMKIVITSSGNTTGTGKTMLAIILARIISYYASYIFDRKYQWNAEDSSFIDVYEYLEKYGNAEKGQVLITDELEYLADKRRSMSNANLFFSQAWAMLRYRNVVTIGTCPGLGPLDRRVPENSDIWINIVYPGYANVYYLSVDDFTGELKIKRLKQMGFAESIRWKPIDKDDDYQTLTQKKHDIGVPGLNKDTVEKFDSEDMDKAQKEREKEITKEVTISLLEMKKDKRLHLTQEEISRIVDRSQQYVSKVKREAGLTA